MQKRKPALSPEAAKILEQYRNKGKTPADDAEGAPGAADDSSPAPRNAAPPAAQMRRSGTRGK